MSCAARSQTRRQSEERAHSQNGDMHEPEERCEQGEASAHRLKQLIKEERQDRVTHQIDEISSASSSIEQLVC